MEIERFLTENKSHILKRWFLLILETYPPETATLLKKEKNQFANPVGHSIHEGIKGIYDELVHGVDEERVDPFLDRIIRVRAVQDFSPSGAVAFIFFLKGIIREALQKADPEENQVAPDELLIIDSRVDALALLGFNKYMECREKLYEIRVNEVKNRTQRLLQRANLIAEMP